MAATVPSSDPGQVDPGNFGANEVCQRVCGCLFVVRLLVAGCKGGGSGSQCSSLLVCNSCLWGRY